MDSQTVKVTVLDHLTAGSIQCLRWKSSGNSRPPRTKADSFFFCCFFFFFSLLFLTASCWQNDDGISWDMNGWKRNGRRLQPWQRVTLSRGRMLMKAGPYSETSLLSRCGPAWPHVNDVASPAPQILPKISCCQVFVSFICEYHISMLYP